MKIFKSKYDEFHIVDQKIDAENVKEAKAPKRCIPMVTIEHK